MRSLLVVTCCVLSLLVAPTASGQTTRSRPKAPNPNPYPLETCPVSGGKLGGMGDPFVYEHEGREVRFCCKGCLPKFQKDPAKYLKAIDAKIIAQQEAHYPTDKCVVSDEPLGGSMGDAVKVVYDNRLVQLCCKRCKKSFSKDPKKYLAKLDQAVIAHHKAHYPLTTCVVSGEKLGSMGDPVDVVVANRLVRLCCAGCKKKLFADPVKYLAMLGTAHGAKDDKHPKPGSGEGHDHEGHDH